jgi:DNA-binding FadR family transcriptional regulator
VEPVAPALAADTATPTPTQRGRIVELAVDLCRLGEAGVLAALLAADIEFHHMIPEANCGDTYCALREVLNVRTQQRLMPHNAREQALRTCEQTAIAIHDDDAATAEACMSSLLAEISAIRS